MKPELEAWLTGCLGAPPGNPELFKQALTHASSGTETHYERLEFLGDAVLKLVVSEWLHALEPRLREGEMTKIRAALVSDRTLAEIASALDLGPHLRMSRAEERTGGRLKPGTLSSALEACLAAIYLRDGLEPARAVVHRHWQGRLEATVRNPGGENAKALLQEFTQDRLEVLPVYRVTGSEGPQHRHVFHVEVEVAGRVLGKGQGPSKKAAEKEAAAVALDALRREHAAMEGTVP